MILEYVKGFLTLFLLIKVLLYFVPKNVFEKYIAFFAGVILVIGLLYPVLQFFGHGEMVLMQLRQEDWEERLLDIRMEAEEVEKTGKTFVEKTYEDAAEKQAVETIVIEAIKIDGGM